MPGSFSFEAGSGEVTEFDDHAGRGTVRDTAGREWSFHCTSIADGSRAIEVGTPVSFDVVAAQLGRWEAANLRPSP